MKKILTAFTAIILLASCQKEINFNSDPSSGSGSTGGGTGSGSGTTSGLLIKTVAVTGSETQTTLYTYDSQKRVESVTTTGTSGGLPIDTYQKFIRDGAGRIVQVKAKQADFMGATSDTTIQYFHYPDATTMNFTYSVQTSSLSLGGISLTTTDSTIYSYTGGKMTSSHAYLSSALLPGMFQETKTDYGFDASNNVNTMKIYSNGTMPGGPLTLVADDTFTYSSTAISGVYASTSGAQNLITNGLPSTTVAAVSKMVTVSNATTTPLNVTTTSTFVTGAGNKVISAQSTSVTSGQPTQNTSYTFTYQ